MTSLSLWLLEVFSLELQLWREREFVIWCGNVHGCGRVAFKLAAVGNPPVDGENAIVVIRELAKQRVRQVQGTPRASGAFVRHVSLVDRSGLGVGDREPFAARRLLILGRVDGDDMGLITAVPSTCTRVTVLEEISRLAAAVRLRGTFLDGGRFGRSGGSGRSAQTGCEDREHGGGEGSEAHCR